VSDLSGRTVLITGGSRGIGRATALHLASLGARVVVTGRTVEALEAGAAQTEGLAVRMDLADRAQTASAIAEVQERAGHIDCLINNAGIAVGAPLHRTTDEVWDRIQQINVHGTMAMCRAFVPAMAKAGWGRVVNVSSLAGLTGQAYTSAYCASKHAVIGLVRALAMEYARTGVTINAVCPGWVETDMAREAIDRIAQSTGRSADHARATLEGASPQGRMVEAEEVAALIGTLCGEASRGIHGQAIPVDGGTVMR